MLAHVLLASALLASASASTSTANDSTTVTVYLEGGAGGTATTKPGLDSGGTAWGTFTDGDGQPSNFGSLSLQSSPRAADLDQMFALGYAEGVLTQRRIYQEVLNLRPVVLEHYGKLPSTDPKDFPAITTFFDDNDKYVRAQAAAHAASSKFWRGVGLVLAQYDGLVAGYSAAAPANETLANFDFQMLNGVGDLFDVIPAVMPSLRRDFAAMTPADLKQYRFESGRCSGLIKVTGDLSDLFFSHASWWSYASMIRMMKHYRTPLSAASGAAARAVSFSSYPGFLESLDDFYMADSGLAMVQTTNNLFNTSLYDLVKPQSVLAWMRVRVAQLMAPTGKEWHALMATENSGTYENQYMIVDLNLFTPGQPLKPHTLWVGEQIPGTYVAADKTDELARGYWPSYNVPYFPEIYDKSGYPAVVAKEGTDASYELAPRAKIFRRDQASVVDMATFKRIMRYNDYQHDPYSAGNPDDAICARGDLSPTRASAGGCLDCKVSSYKQALRLESEVVNGPTSTFSSGGPGQKPFSWSEAAAGAPHAFANMSHVGMPDTFDFVFQTIKPAWTPSGGGAVAVAV